MSDRAAGPSEGGPANHVAGGVSGNLVQVRDIHGDVHFHPPSRPVASLPYRAGVAPQQAAAFQDRVGTTRRLVAALDTAVPTGRPRVHTGVVSGLGGVGKTQVALDYAQRLWGDGEVDVWVWVTAGSREAIVSSYARVAAELTGLEDTDPEQGARRLLEWLAAGSARWLIVLDDVQNPADLRGLWPPATPGGRAVVTTRRRDAALRGPGRRLVEVDVFTPDEAEAYLRAALADQPHLAEGTVELAARLGHLPLALAQAAAYLLDRGLTCGDYLARWTSRRRTLASLLPEDDGLPDEHRATVATTWSLSVEQADRLEPPGIAGALLEVAGVLDPNGIPATLFTAPAITELLTGRTGRDVDAEQARDGLGCLHRLNLITLDPRSDTRTVRVHALVQRANTEALTEAAGEHLWEPGAHAVLLRAGSSLGGRGLVTEAKIYHLRLQFTAEQQLGPDHPDTLTVRGHVARWRGEAGDPAGAAAASGKLLADMTRVLDPDHPDVLTARGNLAFWRGHAGDPAGAVAAFEELLADRVRLLGPDHPHTLAARGNLAYWRGRAGDPAGAAAASEELLADMVRLLGPDHAHTLITRGNLARWRGEAGDPAGAAAAFEGVLADALLVWGPDHPHTFATRNNLACWRGEAGDPAGAVAAFEELLADSVQVLGPDHPDTLTARGHLARWRGEAGDPAGAVAAFEELLPDRVRVLGPDHPDTAAARENLAQWRNPPA
ncbi:tetratricopeptide repeat protein [Amycolatopsis sp. cmx-4-83]|uniref:tetratricopeptide repeat protein n=1 Tax=Amycolatopsis sp. cmx-4-83 TaxID=2790940 RepID=UPI0039789D08